VITLSSFHRGKKKVKIRASNYYLNGPPRRLAFLDTFGANVDTIMSTIISVEFGNVVQLSMNVVDVVVRGLTTSKSSTESIFIFLVYSFLPEESEIKK
jgi:hypothetical protein